MAMKKIILLALITSIGLLTTTQSHSANIAYINAQGGDINYLIGFGNTITNFDNPTGLTLGGLSGYDAVVVASNAIFSEATNIGNVLADFANAGGGVVLTEFVFQGVWALGGTIMTSGYSPFTVDPLSSGYGLSSSLGTIYDSTSPLLTGASGASTDFQADVGLDAGATLIADWTSNRHAIAYNSLSNSSIVGLNLFPDSSYTNDASKTLLANAVEFSLNSHGDQNGSVPEPATFFLIGLGLVGIGLGHRKNA